MIIRKIYHTLTAILAVQEEIRDVLRLHQSQAEATMLTVDALSRNPQFFAQYALADKKADTESTDTKNRGRRRNKPFIALQTICRQYGITDRDLKSILVKNGIKYGTEFFKKAGYKGHVQSMIQEKDYGKVKTALESEDYVSKR